jgi:hypothetical protein
MFTCSLFILNKLRVLRLFCADVLDFGGFWWRFGGFWWKTFKCLSAIILFAFFYL